MRSRGLYLDHEITLCLFVDLMNDYVSMPTMSDMTDELKGYDLVELHYLLQNIKTLRQALMSPDIALDLQEREWLHSFLAGYLYATYGMIDQCELIHAHREESW